MQRHLKYLYAIFLPSSLLYWRIFLFFSLLNFWNLFRLCLHYINKITINNTHFQKLQWRLLSSELRFILQNIMASCMWRQCFISIRSIILTGGLSSLNIIHFCYFSKINFPPSLFFWTLLHSDMHCFPMHHMSSKITWFCIHFKDQVVIKCIIKVS